MALPAAQIRQAWRSALDMDAGFAGLFSKPNLEAAATAVDAWCDANQASYNAALPLPFRTNATAAQKAILLAVIALRRAGAP